jgi:hypothetical protein
MAAVTPNYQSPHVSRAISSNPTTPIFPEQAFSNCHSTALNVSFVQMRSAGKCCLWLVLLLSMPACAQRYVEIAAEIEFIHYQGSDASNVFVRTYQNLKRERQAKTETISLTCIVGTNEWRIDNDYPRDGFQKWFFDRTNLTHSFTPTQLNVCEVRDGTPLGNFGLNLPWLAFCSGGYLKRAGRIVPLPCEDLAHCRDRFAYTDETKTFNDGFGLPRSLDLFTSRSNFIASENDFDNEYFHYSRYGGWIQRTFHYEVTDSTNFLGWNIPLKFEFFQRGRSYEENGNWLTRGHGRVRSIRLGAKPQTIFPPGRRVTIVDERPRDNAQGRSSILITNDAERAVQV